MFGLKTAESCRSVLAKTGERLDAAVAKRESLRRMHDELAARAAAGDKEAESELRKALRVMEANEDEIRTAEAAERGARAQLQAVEASDAEKIYKATRTEIEKRTNEITDRQERALSLMQDALGELADCEALSKELARIAGQGVALAAPMITRDLVEIRWQGFRAQFQASCSQHHHFAGQIGIPLRSPGNEGMGAYKQYIDPEFFRQAMLNATLSAYDRAWEKTQREAEEHDPLANQPQAA